MIASVWSPVYPAKTMVSWQQFFEGHRDMDMPGQVYSWTCSACSIDWVARATNLDPDSNREKTVGELGYPECINPEYGLMSIDCAQRYMEEWGAGATTIWPQTFTEAYEMCMRTTGILNSGSWYHFVAIRGVVNDRLWVANSAPGYKNIWDTISRQQFDAWAGTWKAVVLG